MPPSMTLSLTFATRSAIAVVALGTLASLPACKTAQTAGGSDRTASAGASAITVTPISHATFVLRGDGKVIYNDPVGGAAAFSQQPKADIILVSDIHGDHLDTATIAALFADGARTSQSTALVVPQAVADQLPARLSARATVLKNGDERKVNGVSLEALPMYNLRPEAAQFHVKGRGNGYLLTLAGERIYIAGDTEGIPEMRALKNIDRAFVPMNLPYTMPVAAAAEAVLAFAPKVVYPYHYRGQDGLSDVEAFAKTVRAGGKTEVMLLDWYGKG